MENNTIAVIVCGPNLNDQSKGSFHVHAADCADLKHYGPGTKFGGEKDSTPIHVASAEAVAADVYDNGIMQEGETGADYVHDFHFAPCVKFSKKEKTMSPTMTTQMWEALAALIDDPGNVPSDDCLAVLRRKHFVDKRSTKPTKYGRERSARQQSEAAAAQPHQVVDGKRKPVKKALEIATTKGYGTRRIAGEWHIIDRFGQVIQGNGTFTNDRDAQKEADRLNDLRNQQVLAAA